MEPRRKTQDSSVNGGSSVSFLLRHHFRPGGRLTPVLTSVGQEQIRRVFALRCIQDVSTATNRQSAGRRYPGWPDPAGVGPLDGQSVLQGVYYGVNAHVVADPLNVTLVASTGSK